MQENMYMKMIDKNDHTNEYAYCSLSAMFSCERCAPF